MSKQFDPYRKWLGIPSQDQPPNHYQLLGIPALENDPDVIENAADRQMAHVRTFQSGKHSTASQQILNELSAAKRCLLISEKKADYDTKLKAQLTPASTTAATGQAALPPSPAVQQSPPPLSEPTSDSVQVRSRQSSATRRYRIKHRKSSAIPILLGLIALAVLAGVAILVAHNQKMKTPQQNKFTPEQTTQLVSPRKTIETSMDPSA